MSSTETPPRQQPSLAPDADGVLRVGGTRVRLETVIAAFSRGATPEEILLKYPALDLADIYEVIAHYLRNRESVDAYVAQRALRVEQVERELEARFPSAGVRERLLARRKAHDP
jgi:uncharacterized protein (DUF433 family)